MGRLSDYKKNGEFAALDMDRGCRRYINQSSPGNRKLRRRLKRQERARLNRSCSEKSPVIGDFLDQ